MPAQSEWMQYVFGFTMIFVEVVCIGLLTWFIKKWISDLKTDVCEKIDTQNTKIKDIEDSQHECQRTLPEKYANKTDNREDHLLIFKELKKQGA